MNDPEDFTDEELLKAIWGNRCHEAYPSPEHYYALRGRVMRGLAATVADNSHSDERLQFKTDPANRDDFRTGIKAPLCRRGWWQVAALGLALGLVILVWGPFRGMAAAELSSVLSRLRDQEWIHAITIVELRGELLTSEGWYAPQLRVAGFRSEHAQHFVDYSSGIQSSHVAGQGKVYRWRADHDWESWGAAAVRALLSEGDLSATFPMHHVSSVSTTVIQEDGSRLTRYQFNLEPKRSRQHRSQMTVLVDQATGRVRSWEETHANGKRTLTRFSYPTSGPRSIFDLGVAPETEVIDRIASSDVVYLANQFHDDVINFDDYEALVVCTLDQEQTPGDLWRLVRSGAKYSIERVRLEGRIRSISADLMTHEWWQSVQSDFKYDLLAKSDGERTTLFSLPKNEMPVGELLGNFPHVEHPISYPTLTMANNRGRTSIPVWPGLWPEYGCRPLLLPSDPAFQFALDPAGTGGPEQTVRLEVLTPDEPARRARGSYWLSVEYQHCLAKSLVTRPNYSTHSLRPLEQVIESAYGDYTQSPSGISFAQRRTLKAPDGPQICLRYLVRF